MSQIYAFNSQSGADYGDSVSIIENNLVVGAKGHDKGAVYWYHKSIETGLWSQGGYLAAGQNNIASDSHSFGDIVSSHDNNLAVTAADGLIYTYDMNDPTINTEVALAGDTCLDVHSNTLCTRRPVANACKIYTA